MTSDRVICPRCGESLPPTFDRCDACGAELVAEANSSAADSPRSGAGSRSRARSDTERGRNRSGAGRESRGVPGIAWLLLVVGLAVGGMVGFALHSAIGPRGEMGMPTGPADVMAGAGGSDGGSGMQGGGPPQSMPPQIVQQVREYKAALARNPNDLDANVGLGNLEFDSGQWEKAIEYYSRALAIDPRNPDVRVDRAIAYHGAGQNDLAKKELLKVTREKPTHKNAWLNLGVVMRDLGDRAGAVHAWERYLEIDPQGENAATVRQELETLKQSG